MKEERKRTMSKNFYDDEILFIDELGIHLKPGVKRMIYPTSKNEELENHINYIDLITTKIRRINEQNREEWN